MILSIRHKGLAAFWQSGQKARLPPEHIERIRNILTRLHRCTSAEMMNQPGLGFHGLSGDLKGFWSVKVSRNYRIIFRFEGEDAVDVDYVDYH